MDKGLFCSLGATNTSPPAPDLAVPLRAPSGPALPETVYLPYDVYNQPQPVNYATVRTVDTLRAEGVPVDVTCSNVLNVIAEDAVIEEIARNIRSVIRGGGTAYITIYEGDRSGSGRQTGPDQWQRNEPLRAYLRFFPGAEIRRGMIIARG